MAFLRNRQGVWSAVFALPGNRKKWVKIGKCPKPEAKKILAKLEAEIIAGNFDILESKPIAFDDFTKIYLERIKPVKAENTWKVEKGFIERHLIPYFGIRRIASIRKQDVEDYRNKRSELVKSRTVNLELLCLSAMLRKAVEWKFLQRLPWDRLPMLKVRDAKEIRFLSVGQVHDLKQASTPWIYPFVCLALHSGMRLSEMLWLDWNQIDFERRIIRLYNKPGFSLKNLKAREIPIDDDLYQVLESHWQSFPNPNVNPGFEGAYQPRAENQKQWVFCQPDGKRVQSIRTSFEKACRKAGLEGITVHSLRHTFASHLLMANVPIKTVQTLLGHKSIQITMDIYGHLTPEHVASSINRLPYRESGAKVIPLGAKIAQN